MSQVCDCRNWLRTCKIAFICDMRSVCRFLVRNSILYCICNANMIIAGRMKSASLPSLRVEPELRQAAEQALQQGETLSSFIEASLRANIERRLSQKEFIARGLASQERARRTGEYEDAQVVVDQLQKMFLEEKKRRQ